MESPCQKEKRRTKTQIQKHVLAIRKKIRIVSTQQASAVQASSETGMDLRNSNLGLYEAVKHKYNSNLSKHGAAQYRQSTVVRPEQRHSPRPEYTIC